MPPPCPTLLSPPLVGAPAPASASASAPAATGAVAPSAAALWATNDARASPTHAPLSPLPRECRHGANFINFAAEDRALQIIHEVPASLAPALLSAQTLPVRQAVHALHFEGQVHTTPHRHRAALCNAVGLVRSEHLRVDPRALGRTEVRYPQSPRPELHAEMHSGHVVELLPCEAHLVLFGTTDREGHGGHLEPPDGALAGLDRDAVPQPTGHVHFDWPAQGTVAAVAAVTPAAASLAVAAGARVARTLTLGRGPDGHDLGPLECHPPSFSSLFLSLGGKKLKKQGTFSRSCCRRRMLSAEDKLEQRDIAAMSPGMPSPSQMASPSLARSPPWLETYPELIGQMQGVFEEWREEREQLLRNAEQTQAYCQSLAFQVKSLQEENGRLQKEMARQLQDEEVEQAEALSRLKSECAVLKSAHEALQQEHARTLSEKTRLERENSDLVNALAVEAQGSSTDKVNPSPGPSQRESLVSDDESGLDVMFDQSLAAEMRLVVSPPMPSHLVDVGVVGASRSEELKPVAEVLREGPVPIHT